MTETAEHDRRGWRRHAIEGLAAAVEATPDATIPAYPRWSVRDLAQHVLQVHANAVIALTRPDPRQRPEPDLVTTRDDAPTTLGGAVRRAGEQSELALTGCRLDEVWTPVGPRPPSFWARRLLREGILHTWDAEQAGGSASPPGDAQAEDLIDEFLATDIARALNGGRGPGGALTIAAGTRLWSLDLRDGSVVSEPTEAPASRVDGDPPSVWLWLMRREDRPGRSSVEDGDGSVRTFETLIDGFNRPSS